MRWLLAPATFTTLLLAITSRGAGHIWLQNRPFDLPMSVGLATMLLLPACFYLGWRKAQVLAGALGALATAIAAAGAFFLTARVLGESAAFVGWLCGWVVLSLLQTMLDGRLQVARGIVRGGTAALVGAAGFAVVLFQLAHADAPENAPIFSNLLAWVLAYAPGSTMLMRR